MLRITAFTGLWNEDSPAMRRAPWSRQLVFAWCARRRISLISPSTLFRMIKELFGNLYQLLIMNPHLFTLADNPVRYRRKFPTFLKNNLQFPINTATTCAHAPPPPAVQPRDDGAPPALERDDL